MLLTAEKNIATTNWILTSSWPRRVTSGQKQNNDTDGMLVKETLLLPLCVQRKQHYWQRKRHYWQRKQHYWQYAGKENNATDSTLIGKKGVIVISERSTWDILKSVFTGRLAEKKKVLTLPLLEEGLLVSDSSLSCMISVSTTLSTRVHHVMPCNCHTQTHKYIT